MTQPAAASAASPEDLVVSGVPPERCEHPGGPCGGPGCVSVLTGYSDDSIGVAVRSMLAAVEACAHQAAGILDTKRYAVVNLGPPRGDALVLMEVAERTLAAARLLATTWSFETTGTPILGPRRTQD